MTYSVDVSRSRYLGNRADIWAFHERLSIEIDCVILYGLVEEGHKWVRDLSESMAPSVYRFTFEDPDLAMLFKLTFV